MSFCDCNSKVFLKLDVYKGLPVLVCFISKSTSMLYSINRVLFVLFVLYRLVFEIVLACLESNTRRHADGVTLARKKN